MWAQLWAGGEILCQEPYSLDFGVSNQHRLAQFVKDAEYFVYFVEQYNIYQWSCV